MNVLLVLLFLLALYVAALKWIPVTRVSADQERIDRELAAMQAHQAG